MKKILFGIFLLSLFLVSACSLMEKKIPTDQKNCKNESTNGLLSIAYGPMSEQRCKTICPANGYQYKRWICGEGDIMTCICS